MAGFLAGQRGGGNGKMRNEAKPKLRNSEKWGRKPESVVQALFEFLSFGFAFWFRGIRSRLARAEDDERRRDAIDNSRAGAEAEAMSKLEIIETEVRNMPREEAFKLQDWLADYLEDQAELNPEFIASIERGKADLREGRVRVRKG